MQAKYKTFGTGGLVLMLVLWSAQSSAQPGPPPFGVFDGDGDGMISAQEFNDFRARRMQSRAAEGRMMRGAANAPAFEDIDANGDGQISREELGAMRQQRFRQRQDMRGGQGMRGRPGMGMGGGPRRGPMAGPGRRGDRPMGGFFGFDADGDGVVSRQEFEQGRAQRRAERAQQGYPMRNQANAPSFEEIDRNGNGVVTAREFDEFRAQRMRQRWQNR